MVLVFYEKKTIIVSMKAMNNKKNVEHDFSKGSMIRNILSMAVPVTIAQAVQLLYNLVDRVYLGHIGQGADQALTGVGLVFPIISIVSAFTQLYSGGGAPLMSIARGAGEEEKALKLENVSFVLLILTGVVLMGVFYIFMKPILYLLGASDATYPVAASYLQIYLLGTLFIMISSGMNLFINAQGFGTMGMMTVCIGAVLNLFLDPLFIFGFKWGIKGGAWATVTGQMVSALLVIIYFSKFRKMELKPYMFRPQLTLLKAICSLGLASCINQLAITAVQIVMNNVLRHYGAASVYGSDIPIACVGIISKVNMVFMSICIGVSQGSQPIWGFNYGAKKFNRVRQTYKYSATICTTVAVIFFLCFQLFPHQIVGAFGSGSDLYFQFAERYLKIFMLLTFVNGIQPMSSGFFTSMGKARLGVIVSLTRQVIFLLPLVVIFPLLMGIDGVMYAGPIADAAALVLTIYFTRRELLIMKQDTPQ